MAEAEQAQPELETSAPLPEKDPSNASALDVADSQRNRRLNGYMPADSGHDTRKVTSVLLVSPDAKSAGGKSKTLQSLSTEPSMASKMRSVDSPVEKTKKSSGVALSSTKRTASYDAATNLIGKIDQTIGS